LGRREARKGAVSAPWAPEDAGRWSSLARRWRWTPPASAFFVRKRCGACDARGRG